MKQIKIVGLALVAMFALSAVGASTASALIEKAEFLKSGTKNGFTGKSKLPLLPTLYANNVQTVRCKMDTSKGTVGGNKSMKVEKATVIFTECEGFGTGGTTCTVKSAGAPVETLIATKPLDGELRRVLKSEAATEVGLELLPESGTEFTTLEGACLLTGGSKVTGKVTGEVNPINKNQTTGENLFGVNAVNEQLIKKTCFLGPSAVFGATPPCAGTLAKPVLNAFGLEAAEMTAEELTFEEATEVFAK